MERQLKHIEYSAILHAVNNKMKFAREVIFDPEYVKNHPYRSVWASEYRMKRDYHIVRDGGLDDYLIILTVSGAGLANGTELEPFSIYLFSPHTPQDYRTDPVLGEWHFLWAHFHAPADWLPLLDWKTFSIQSAPVAERRRIVAHFREIIPNSSTGSGYDEVLAMNLLENILLRLAKIRATGDNLDFREDVRMYVLAHLAENLTVPALAAFFRLSPSRFAHRFRDAFGASPQAYVEGCRLEMARRLLLTTAMSIKEVALTCGFADPLYFSKRFTRAAGMPPSEWRKPLCGRGCSGNVAVS